MRWLAYTNASAQNVLSNDALDNKYWSFYRKEWFIFLAIPCIPFIKWIPIPVFWLNHRNWSLYSPTLSIWSTLIFLSVCFSIILFHFINIFRTSNICLIEYTQHCPDISSINETKYRWLSSCSLSRAPNTNMNTIKKIFRVVSCSAKFHLYLLIQNTMSTNFQFAGRCSFQ